MEDAGQRQAQERVRGVEVAEGELVADVGPADLALQGDRQAFIREVPEVRGGDEGCGVDERDESHPQHAAARHLLMRFTTRRRQGRRPLQPLQKPQRHNFLASAPLTLQNLRPRLV